MVEATPNDAAVAALVSNDDQAVQTPPDTQEAPVKMTPFDEKQQAKVTELIIRGKSEAAKELRAEHARLKAEHDALKASINLPQDELAAITDKLAVAKQEYARVEGLNLAARKKEALQAASRTVNFFDETVGATVMAGEVTTGEGGALVVVDPATGERRINQFGEPMTIADLAREKAQQMPYMVKSTLKSGAGSVAATGHASQPQYALGDIFGPKSDGALAQRLAKSNPATYKRMRLDAVKAGYVY